MDRRTFLAWVSVGALASSLPVALAACTSEKTDTTATKPSDSAAPARADGFTVVGTVKDLDRAGFIQDKNFAAGPLLVIYDPTDKSKLVAIDSTCTHKGCTVDWKKDAKTLACPVTALNLSQMALLQRDLPVSRLQPLLLKRKAILSL